jgi:hypothetical protein
MAVCWSRRFLQWRRRSPELQPICPNTPAVEGQPADEERDTTRRNTTELGAHIIARSSDEEAESVLYQPHHNTEPTPAPPMHNASGPSTDRELSHNHTSPQMEDAPSSRRSNPVAVEMAIRASTTARQTTGTAPPQSGSRTPGLTLNETGTTSYADSAATSSHLDPCTASCPLQHFMPPDAPDYRNSSFFGETSPPVQWQQRLVNHLADEDTTGAGEALATPRPKGHNAPRTNTRKSFWFWLGSVREKFVRRLKGSAKRREGFTRDIHLVYSPLRHDDISHRSVAAIDTQSSENFVSALLLLELFELDYRGKAGTQVAVGVDGGNICSLGTIELRWRVFNDDTTAWVPGTPSFPTTKLIRTTFHVIDTKEFEVVIGRPCINDN